MSKDLKIQVLLNAIDKLTTPFRNASKQIQATSSTLRANKVLLKKLEKAQERIKNTGLPQAQERLKNKIEQTNQSIKKQENALKQLNLQAKKQQQYTSKVQSLKNASQFTSSFGQRSMMHGAAVLGSSSLAMRPALNFEQEFSKVQALTRLDSIKDAEKIKQLRDQAKHLGATTSFTAGDVAAGQGYLAMAGFNQQEIIDSMPAVLNMTKAAGMEMGRVSDISSDISSGFKIPASEMNKVADVLTLTFTSSNTNLELLGETMKYLGPIAASTGQDFETMSAMVGLLGNVGIKGSQAGTSLRSAMLRLAGPPKQAKKALDKLGVSAKDAKGNMRSMTDILIDISKKTEKMGSGKKMEYYKAIFGAEAATAMVELVNQSGTKGIQEFAGQLKNASGTAEKVAQTMSDNVMGDLKNLESAAESITISIFDETKGEIRELIQQSTDFLRKINEWIQQNPKLTASIMKWVGSVSGGLVAIGALNLAFSYLLYPVGRIILFTNKLTGATKLFNWMLFDQDKKLKKVKKSLFSYKTTMAAINNAEMKATNSSKSLATSLRLLPTNISKGVLALKTKKFWLMATQKSWGIFIGILKFGARLLLSPLKLLLFAFSPIGLAISALVAGAALLITNWGYVKAFFGGFWEGLKQGLAPVLEKFKPLGDAFGVVVGWIEQAVKWFTDLFSPIETTQKNLEEAANAGKKFGEWIALGIDIATKPLQWLMDSIQWVIDSMPSFDKFKSITPSAEQINKYADIGANMYDPNYEPPKLEKKWIGGLVGNGKGFASGGYTGNGGKYTPMGIVHGGEYVMTKEATSRLGVGLLNSLNYGKNAMLATGLGVSVATAQPIQFDNRPPLNHKPATMTANGNAPMQVTININGSGQSAVDIAQEVRKELQRLEMQRQAKARSSLRDRD